MTENWNGYSNEGKFDGVTVFNTNPVDSKKQPMFFGQPLGLQKYPNCCVVSLSNTGYLKSSYLCMPRGCPKNIGCFLLSTGLVLNTVTPSNLPSLEYPFQLSVIRICSIRSYMIRSRHLLFLFLQANFLVYFSSLL